MKKFAKILTISLLCLSAGDAYSQDPQFTQFYANPIYLNPAFAGSNGCPRFGLNYRNEWPNLTGNYVTYSAAYDQYFKNISGGIGVLATHDQQGQGTIYTSMLGLIYSYHLKVNRKFSMLFGARAAMYNKYLDWDKLTFGDMIDPRRGFIYQTGDVPRGGSRYFFDASAGFVGYSKNFFFGFAAHHLNRPNESVIVGESKLPMRFTGHMGAEIKLGGKSQYKNITSIMPNIVYQYQNGFQEINIGTYVKYGAFTVGAWFRNKDAFILSIGLSTQKFKLGYSYDVTVSKLNNGVSGGSHEVSLGLNLNCRNKPVSFRTISCPSF
ncbi:MAG: type IX secretion system membrane protein PorP/SprF [Crocinitomicaceae bacterium]|nr:type IX secretion system membrane protein PorP/SprF [Crocinitomicaceae bacterium]MDG1658684.1 type IX secretion system membrane protein PorP/SprF [Crocinitomicaceae bacterium]|tara:strand:+ start:735 stop:1703 length:969 start_codon:yes stop_codon:yes gene_type:complete